MKKPHNELREFRISHNLIARDMIAVVRERYPKYDKIIQSKVEHGEDYGIQLREDAMDALYARFGQFSQGTEKRRSGDRHKLTCRISCRLPDTVYDVLQQQIREEGYGNVQDWLKQQVDEYLHKQSTTAKTKGAPTNDQTAR